MNLLSYLSKILYFYSCTFFGCFALSNLIILLLALFISLRIHADIFSYTFWQPSVYLQLNHQLLLINEFWKTGRVFFLQETYVIEFFFKVALLTTYVMVVFDLNSFPVPHSPFHGALGQDYLLQRPLFTHCRLCLIILVDPYFFIQLLNLVLQLRNTFGF